MEYFNYHSPIGRRPSDHVCLEIICDFDVDKIEHIRRFDYSKGDYANLRKFLNADWFTVFNPQINDRETMWQLLKDKLIVGEKLFVPQVKMFRSILPHTSIKAFY